MDNQVFIVDRDDQVIWYLPKDSVSFCIKLEDNHAALRDWLVKMCKDRVVVSAQGVMPRCGSSDHAFHSLYEHVQRHQYKIYFGCEQDATAFKLAWGGSL